MRTPFAVLALSFITVAALGACREPKVPSLSNCDDHRRLLDCDAEIAYQGIKTEGSAHVLNLGGAQASFADTAVRQTNVQVEAYIAGQTRLCRSFNSCVGTPETYLTESLRASDRLADSLAALVGTVPAANRPSALAATDLVLTRVGETPSPLSFRFSLDATLPPSAGGANLTVPPNHPLPTETRVSFKVDVSRTAHVYLFQVDAQNKVSVLFPDERIAVKNPLQGGAPVLIPPPGRQKFRLDDKDMGTERVYILASLRPLPRLEQTLKRYASGEVEELSKSELAEFGSIAPGTKCTRSRALRLVDDGAAPAAPAEPGCVASRGFVLDDAPAPNQRVAHSLEARASSGDGVVIKVFPFQHVTEAEYPAVEKAYNEPTPAGAKTRGIAIDI